MYDVGRVEGVWRGYSQRGVMQALCHDVQLCRLGILGIGSGKGMVSYYQHLRLQILIRIYKKSMILI